MTAIRTVRGYRTISYASATVLVASPPFELQALALQRMYHQLQGLGSGGDTPSVGQSVRYFRGRKGSRLGNGGVGAVLPNWEVWRDHGGLPLTYRMTQVLTRHGAFGEFLLRIRRQVTSTCHHCEEEEDTAQHTLEFWPAWEEPRRVLRLAIGENLAPEAIVEAMLREQQKYMAVRSYCE
ncbi:uncharacterized protein LOC117212455 [Bombus bifarius]|uniref:Uncharacterized protein LOC117212455 n=1 Tax=Bombus bifarius TaxID=103933 RepID=A0A6P8NF00_9HYME|nr:uncharacterized protein LOC117212455 [Bombus bifarius]